MKLLTRSPYRSLFNGNIRYDLFHHPNHTDLFYIKMNLHVCNIEFDINGVIRTMMHLVRSQVVDQNGFYDAASWLTRLIMQWK